MKPISLSNFLAMHPDVPEYSSKNQHYLLSGVNPTYYLETAGVQEEQAAPLIASLDWTQITASLDGNVVAMCSGSLDTSSFAIFLITTTSMVWGITRSPSFDVVPLGYPTGSLTSVTDASITYVNNQIYVTIANIGALYHLSNINPQRANVSISISSPATITLANHGFVAGKAIVFSTTGTLPTGLIAGLTYYVISNNLTLNTFEVSATFNGSPVNTSGTQSGTQMINSPTGVAWPFFTLSGGVQIGTVLEPFEQVCMISQGSQVNQITSSYDLIPGIDFGAGTTVLNLKNYNDKYLAIATAVGDSFVNQYVHLWDAATNSFTPTYSMKVSGRFVDFKVINSMLYVVVQDSIGKTSVYYLKNVQLAPLFTPQYSNVVSTGQIYDNAQVNSIFNYKNSLGLLLESTSDLNYPLMVYGNSPAGKSEFILTSGNQMREPTLGADGYLYAFTPAVGTGATLSYYPVESGNYQNILYKSQWIPVANVSGLDVWYDTPPQSGTDAINVTIYGRGEDIITGTSTTVLSPITPTKFLNQQRTRMDVQGFTGDKIRIVLSTTNTTWRPTIRDIEII